MAESLLELFDSRPRLSDVAAGGDRSRERKPRPMKTLFKEIIHNPLLWLLAFVPVVLVANKLKPESHTLLFVLSVLIVFMLFRPTGILGSPALQKV